jgi:hypothetical protein
VVEELEEQMSSMKSQRQQETARTLLAEMGGTAALRKLSARSNSADRYATLAAQAGEEVNRMFDKSMREAHTGFRVALFMDVVVFAVGIALVVAAALQMMVTTAGGHAVDPTTAGATGGVGMLSVLYSMLVGRSPNRCHSRHHCLTNSRVLMYKGKCRSLTGWET